MITALIVDDEHKARLNLAQLVHSFCPDVELIGEASTIQDARSRISAEHPELIFLDIQMKGESGFDLLNIDKQHDYQVIFTTAHDEYAIKAFKFSAVDYLLKPIDVEELKRSVKRAVNSRASRSENEKLQLLTESLIQGGNRLARIALPTLEGLTFVRVDEIIRCESDENYTNFFLSTGAKTLVSKTIKHFEDLLAGHNFVRVHRSHLVNLDHIRKYYKGDGGYILMSDGSEVVVSRRKKDAFLQSFQQS